MNVIFARYNRHRLPQFQIETSIVALNNAKVVVKKALGRASEAHIRAISDGYDLVRGSLNPGGLLLPNRMAYEKPAITFEYIEGESIDRLLLDAFRAGNRDAFIAIIDAYRALIEKAFRPPEARETGPKIAEVFGVQPGILAAEGCWLPVGAIDAVFENIIRSGNKHYLIDIEWVFPGALPVDFVLYRSLFYFHQVKYFELGIDKRIGFEELLAHCGIKPGAAKLFREMDESFQSYVYGPERCYKFKENYLKRQVPLHSLEKTIEHQRDVVRKYHGEIVGMRGEIAERDRIIGEIVNSFGWRLWQKISGAIAFVCPSGSRRRRAFDRLLAPLKSR
ncbi:MAG: hypothetical protein WC299_05575 [Kiritimatiellia bacterium]